MFAAEEPDEVPDIEGNEQEEAQDEAPVEKEEPPELNLSPKQNHMRTDLEMWVMDEIPALYGVDDSEELDESLQEDGQADKITFLIANPKDDSRREALNAWLKDVPDQGAKDTFMEEILGKVKEIRDA